MSEERIREMARHFPENGMKLLLQTPANLHDLLTISRWPLLGQIDLRQLTVDPTTYVTADYRHAASDLVLSVPWRVRRSRKKQALWLTILLEHQSEPDRLMMLRLLEYMVHIWKKQVRDHVRQHGSAASVKLQPILPVVFYTGPYQWERLGQLIDLMVEAADLKKHIPEFAPVFVNLPDLSGEQLAAAGAFGQVLRVVQQRKESRRAFEQALGSVVDELVPLARSEHERWLDLLSYLTSLVYHQRAENEHGPLHGLIQASARTDRDREELDMARKTMAQVLREEGQADARREHAVETLVTQLQLAFGKLPANVEQTIRATRDPDLLDRWLRQFATALSLDDVGIAPQE